VCVCVCARNCPCTHLQATRVRHSGAKGPMHNVRPTASKRDALARSAVCLALLHLCTPRSGTLQHHNMFTFARAHIFINLHVLQFFNRYFSSLNNAATRSRSRLHCTRSNRSTGTSPLSTTQPMKQAFSVSRSSKRCSQLRRALLTRRWRASSTQRCLNWTTSHRA
jgi:hypothetical protein